MTSLVLNKQGPVVQSIISSMFRTSFFIQWAASIKLLLMFVLLKILLVLKIYFILLQPITSKNDVTLCKLDVNVKNRTVVASLKLSRDSLKEKVLLYSKFYLKIQMWKTKRYAKEKVSIMGVWCG